VAAIEHLRQEHKAQTIALFSHGDWIRLALAHFMGVHIDLYRRLAVDPVSVSALSFHEYGPVVRLVNECGSLGTLTPPKAPKQQTKAKSK
jgi:probable phosphoglycerate mutase